jgi:hypothetical protein
MQGLAEVESSKGGRLILIPRPSGMQGELFIRPEGRRSRIVDALLYPPAASGSTAALEGHHTGLSPFR